MMQSRINRSVAHRLLKRVKQKASKTRETIKDKILYPVRDRAKLYSNKGRRDIRRLKTWLSSEGVRYVKYLKPYAAYVFIYGFILNYTLSVLLSFPLNYNTVPAWGIAYYFLKEETTQYIHEIRGRRNR